VDDEAEFSEDFGAGLSEADVRALVERARTTGDRELRLLAKQYLTLRRVASDLLAYMAERGYEEPEAPERAGQPLSYPVGFMRFLLRDTGRTSR
jgi:hypothetical protein